MMMRNLLLPSLILTMIVSASFIDWHQPEPDFKIRVVASGLSDPWSVVTGPDQQLWVTESKGYRVSKINPQTGKRSVVLDLNSERKFPSFSQLKAAKQSTPQGGLMGLAVHPDFLKGKPYIYLSYVYQQIGERKFRLKLARYAYNSGSGRLESPKIICDTIPASNDHNGGRMAVGRVNGKAFLFYTVGDQGHGQFVNGGVPNNAQNMNSYEGKILRYALEPDKTGNWVPQDNPDGQASAIWTSGHRNPQGLAFTLLGGKERLYSSEHGPYSDDEINLIEKGMNYGHPLIMGYADGNYDGLAASVSDEKDRPGKWHTTYPVINHEKRNADSLKSQFRPPVMSFFPSTNAMLITLFNQIQTGGKADWQAYAPSGIAVYKSLVIPGWQQSLLIASLKRGRLLRLKLREDGSVVDKVYEYAPSSARYRDVTVSEDGSKIYLATDSSAITSGPTAENPKATSQRGCILELSYSPARAAR